MFSIKTHMTKALLVTAALGTLATAGAGTALATSPAASAEISVTSTAELTRHQPAPSASMVAAGYAWNTGEVVGTRVNLRTMPTIPSGIRGQYNSGMNVTVQCWAPYAYNNHWLRVKIGGSGAPTGYMARQYVRWTGYVEKCAGF